MQRPQIRYAALITASLIFSTPAWASPQATEKDPAAYPALATSPAAEPRPVSQDQQLDSGRYVTAAGELFTYTKALVGGRETVTYTNGTVTLDRAGMQDYEAAHPPPVLSPVLAQRAADSPAGTPISALVWLVNNPKANIVRQLRAERMPAIDALAEQVRATYRAALPVESIPEDEERDYAKAVASQGGVLSELDQAKVASLSQQIEDAGADLRTEVNRRLQLAIADDQAALADLVVALGGTYLAPVMTINGAVVELPSDQLATLAANPLIARLTEVPVGEPELDVQGTSLGATTGFWAANPVIDGGVWDAGVLDTGVQQNHPNLTHLNFLSTFGTTDSNGHGTGVAGIISSDHSTVRGMAYGMDTMLVGSCAGSVPVVNGNDVVQHADWMVSTAMEDPEAINLSCGYGTANNIAYSPFEQFVDALIDDNSVLLVKSTGNGGDGTTTITHPASAYNLMAVANMNDANTAVRSDDVITGSSSRGPTLGGRKKPDISAPGNDTTSLNNNWATQPDFSSIGGTSAAAPHVTGGAILLTDLRGSDTPYVNKAILINSADAWSDNGTSGNTADDGQVVGSLWNKTYGWGYLDLWEAWFNGLDYFDDTVDDGITPPGRDFKLYVGQMLAGEKATLAWNRHLGYNGTNFPAAAESLSDLDLHAYNAVTGDELDSSTSALDNVEQVAVSTAQNTVLRVEAFGEIDPDVGVESYALATEEIFVAATGPSFTRSWSTSLSSPGVPFSFIMNWSNVGDLSSFHNTVSMTVPAGWSVTPASVNLGTLAPAASPFPSIFTVTPPCTTGTVSGSQVTNSSSSYGEVWSASSSPTFNLGVTALTPDVPISSSRVPQTYSFDVVSFDWHIVAVQGQGVDRDVWADNDMCMSSPYQTSTLSSSMVDFTATNGMVYGSTLHYGMVTFGPSGNGNSYTVETDQADDLGIGATGSETFDLNEPAELFEISVAAGTRFGFRVQPTSGSPELAVFLFSPDRADGDRANADAASPSGGGRKTVMFDATESGNYAAVVVNDNGNASTFTYEVLSENVFADGFEGGNTSAWSAVVP